MRDMVLAEQFLNKGHQITFACLPLKGNAIEKIQQKGFEVIELSNNSDDELIKLINESNINLLIIDHYQIEKASELNIRNRTKALVFVVDDLYKEHDCDFILNHNISGDQKRYDGKVPAECIIMAGPQYALIRKEFKITEIEKRSLNVEKRIPVFVTFGGSDPTNLSYEVVEKLKSNDRLQLNVFTTTSNPNLESLKNQTATLENVQLFINETNLASKMKTCTFAIVSPSVTCLESIYMELPLIAIKAVSNQQNTYNYLKKHNLLALESKDIDRLETYISRMINPAFFNPYYQHFQLIKQQNFNTQNKSIYELVIARANDKTEGVRNHHDS